MPTGVYKRTEEMKKNMSVARLKRKQKLGYINSPETREKMSDAQKGEKSHLYGIIGEKHPMYGKHHTEATKKNISAKMSGKNNPNWKGDEISIRALHWWVTKHKPKPVDGKCELCHKIKDKYGKTKLVLSNIKEHQYKRNIDDFQWVHYSCHSIYDAEGAWSSERRKALSERNKKNNPMKRPEVIKKANKTKEKNKANKTTKTIKPETINSRQLVYWLK